MAEQRPFRRKFRVPIYNSTVTLVVADDLVEASRGSLEPGQEACAWCITSGGNAFELLFQRKGLTMGTIVHELFHLTHRILEHVGHQTDPDHHEPAAYLNEYLFVQVVGRVIKFL